MDKNAKFYFTNKQIEGLFNVNRKVLLYWRKIGIISPTIRTEGGHCRYSFNDLVAIKAIKALKEAGISTHKIKKLVSSLKKRYPELKVPMSEKSFQIIGKEVAVINENGVYDPITGQGIINNDIKSSVKDITLEKFDIPAIIKERVAREQELKISGLEK